MCVLASSGFFYLNVKSEVQHVAATDNTRLGLLNVLFTRAKEFTDAANPENTHHDDDFRAVATARLEAMDLSPEELKCMVTVGAASPQPAQALTRSHAVRSFA